MSAQTVAPLIEGLGDTDLLAIWGMGPLELGIILVIVLLIFGAGKLPKIGKQLGDAMSSFKNAKAGLEDKSDDAVVEKSEKKAEKQEEVELG